MLTKNKSHRMVTFIKRTFKMYLRNFFYLHVVQLYRCSTAKYLYHYFQFLLFFIHLFNSTIKIIKWSVYDLDSFTNNIWFSKSYTLLAHFVHLAKHLVHFRFAKRSRMVF